MDRYIKHSKHYKQSVQALAELALKEADLQYKKNTPPLQSSVVREASLWRERLHAELKAALQKFRYSRCGVERLQEKFGRFTDSSLVESLNFLAFCKYSQSVCR